MAVRGLLIKRAVFLAKKKTSAPVDDPVPTLLLQAQDTVINVPALAELSDELFSISGDKAPLIWASYTSPYAQVLGLLMSVERNVGSIATFTVCGKQIPRPLCCQMNLLEAIDEELFMDIGPKKTISQIDFKRALVSQRRAQEADQLPELHTLFRLFDSMAESGGGDISCAGFGVMLATMKIRTAEPEIFMKGGSATFTKGALKIALENPNPIQSNLGNPNPVESSPAADWGNPDWSLLEKLCEVYISCAADGQIECAAFGATLEIGRLAQRAACSGSRGRWVYVCGCPLYETGLLLID
jgi:hypothetical protein